MRLKRRQIGMPVVSEAIETSPEQQTIHTCLFKLGTRMVALLLLFLIAFNCSHVTSLHSNLGLRLSHHRQVFQLQKHI